MSTTPPTTPPPLPSTTSFTPLSTPHSITTPYPPLPSSPPPQLSLRHSHSKAHTYPSTPSYLPSRSHLRSQFESLSPIPHRAQISEPPMASEKDSNASTSASPTSPIFRAETPQSKHRGTDDPPVQIPRPVQPLGAPRQERPRSPARHHSLFSDPQSQAPSRTDPQQPHFELPIRPAESQPLPPHSPRSPKRLHPQPLPESDSHPNTLPLPTPPQQHQSSAHSRDEAHASDSSSDPDTDTDPLLPLPPVDWPSFETRYTTALAEVQATEVATATEFTQLLSFFSQWQQAGEVHEEARATKRLRTRTAYVREKETRLEDKVEHLRVVRAKFEEALALLG